MAAIACAERVVSAPLPEAFARFIDFSTWDLWMPKRFRPISGPARALREGDTFKMAVGAGLPLELQVIRLRPGVEVCWKGGVPLGLAAEHSFFFREAEAGGGTVVRSEDIFSGALSVGPLSKLVERTATALGETTLVSFSTYIERGLRAA